MTEKTSVVAIFKSHIEAESAVKELQQSGFDMKKLSIVGRDYHTDENVVGYYNTGDRMKHWGKLGAFWGGFWGLLFGSAFFLVPGVGPLLMAGPVVGWIVGTLEGAVVVGGLSALGAGLYSIGIPKDSILRYETAVKSGKYVLIAHGSDVETVHAREIISRTNPETLESHQPAGTEARAVARHNLKSPERGSVSRRIVAGNGRLTSKRRVSGGLVAAGHRPALWQIRVRSTILITNHNLQFLT